MSYIDKMIEEAIAEEDAKNIKAIIDGQLLIKGENMIKNCCENNVVDITLEKGDIHTKAENEELWTIEVSDKVQVSFTGEALDEFIKDVDEIRKEHIARKNIASANVINTDSVTHNQE